ncbi:MAG: cyclase family protein [Thermoprotei archaeon]
MRIAKIYDLTSTITTHMPIWPTSPLPVVTPVGIAARDGYNVESYTSLTHTGTHIDAPYHFIENGKTVDHLELERLVSHGYCIRPKTHGQEITRADIWEKWRDEYGGSTLLIDTGWSRKRGFTKSFLYEFPGLSEDAADFLIAQKVGVIGIDTLGIEPYSHTDFRVHKKLLSHDIILIEDLAGLEQLQEGTRYTIVALPVKIGGASGAMSRVIAIQEEGEG